MHGASPLQQAEAPPPTTATRQACAAPPWRASEDREKAGITVKGPHAAMESMHLQRACPDALWAVVGGVVGCAVQQEGNVQPRQVPIVSPVGEDEGVILVLWDCLQWVRGAKVCTAGAS